jgi:hypothetical protein
MHIDGVSRKLRSLRGLRPTTRTQRDPHMADSPAHADSNGETGNDTGVAPENGSTTGTPRWVKVFGTVVAVAVLLFVIVLLTRGPGGHGPGRHSQSGGTGARTAPVSVVDDRASFPGPVGPALRSSGHASP